MTQNGRLDLPQISAVSDQGAAQPAQLVDAWTRAAGDWDVAPATAIAVALGWDRFAGELERLFENLVNERKLNTRAPAGDAPA